MAQSDNEFVASWIPLVNFLGASLGRNYEVVLHDLSDLDHSVIAIANGHVSQRSVGSPATDLVLRVLEGDAAENDDFVVKYRGSVPESTKVLASSTFFIRRDERIVGVLCINADHTLLAQLESLAASIRGSYADDLIPLEESSAQENLTASIADVAAEAVRSVAAERHVSSDHFKLEERVEVIRRLYGRGFFQFKGAVQTVSTALHISEPTAYRYVQMVRVEDPD